MRFVHSMIRVRDLDAALHFFCDLLGLSEVRRRDSERQGQCCDAQNASDDLIASHGGVSLTIIHARLVPNGLKQVKMVNCRLMTIQEESKLRG